MKVTKTNVMPSPFSRIKRQDKASIQLNVFLGEMAKLKHSHSAKS